MVHIYTSESVDKRKIHNWGLFWRWWRCRKSHKIREPLIYACNSCWRRRRRVLGWCLEENRDPIAAMVHSLLRHCMRSQVPFVKLPVWRRFWPHTTSPSRVCRRELTAPPWVQPPWTVYPFWAMLLVKGQGTTKDRSVCVGKATKDMGNEVREEYVFTLLNT